MNTNLIPLRDTGCEEEVLEGEIVVYSAVAGKALYLNDSAALVWQLIDSHRSIGQIEFVLTDAYPDAITLKDDLRQVINDLLQHGVISL